VLARDRPGPGERGDGLWPTRHQTLEHATVPGRQAIRRCMEGLCGGFQREKRESHLVHEELERTRLGDVFGHAPQS
jgi:hypothetical protein